MNESTQTTFTIDEVLNALDSLETACLFLDRADKFKWKWIAIALDHALYGFCISAIAMHDPFNVWSGTNDNMYMFEQAGHGWMKSHKVMFDEGPAYRIEWKPCIPPPEIPCDSDPIEQRFQRLLDGDIIGFWSALARVQDSVLWMARMSHTQALHLTDEQMRRIIFLHNYVRNKIAHFMPKTYTFSVPKIQAASKDIINAIGELVFKSFAIYSSRVDDIRSRTKTAIIRFADYYEAQQHLSPESNPQE